MGKGKARGMGAAELVASFLAFIKCQSVWLAEKFLKELEAQKKDVRMLFCWC